MRWLIVGLGGCSGSEPSAPADLDGDGATAEADCDDQNAVRHPGADERCDGVDDDCDGEVDEDAVDRVLVDRDGDGFGVDGQLACADGSPVPAAGGDCDDDAPARHPGAPELCNGVDDDCDADTPEVAQVGDVGFPDVAGALEAVPDGGVVQVCSGTHLVSRLLVSKAVTVIGDAADPAAVVLDAGGQGSVFAVSGGALVLEGLTLTGGFGMPAPALEDETAGGAVSALVGVGGPVTARSCVFTGNRAWGGGAIAGTEITLEDCTLEDNRAEGDGGAVLVRGDEQDASLAVVRTLLRGNQAGSGGAVHARLAAVTFTDSELRENVASGGGGGVYAVGFDPGSLSFVGSTIADNQAYVCGGIDSQYQDVTLDDATTVTGNAATFVGGGACIDSHTWTGGTFVGNTAELGGGLQSWDDPILSGVVLRDNVASDGGGGAYLTGDAILTGVTLSGNEAQRGGGIEHTHSLTLTDSTVTDNVASDRGGGLYGGEASTTVASNVSFAPGDNIPEDVAVTNGTAVVGFDYGEAASFECEARPTPVCRDEEAR